MENGVRVLESPALASLIPLLAKEGYQVVGPSIRDGAIGLETLEKLEDLPIGWGDQQEAGRYRLRRRGDTAVFGYTLGPQGWKRYLHPPELTMFEARRENGSFQILRNPAPPPRLAFLGVRACELAGIRLHDRIFLGDRYLDPGYKARRERVLIIAVNCTDPGNTCFCASLGTGPLAGEGFDLVLTELARDGRRIFLAEAASTAGAGILAGLEQRDPQPDELEQAAEAMAGAAGRMGRALDTEGLRELLYDNFDHPRWDRVAARCLSCANCTQVCPTCFCTTLEDSTGVTGERAERRRVWDSCFTDSFSYIHGGNVRQSVKSRYRQWLTHKLAAWEDQFGTLGCVGCGRCITWCPGQIDITEEVRAIRGVPETVAG